MKLQIATLSILWLLAGPSFAAEAVSTDAAAEASSPAKTDESASKELTEQDKLSYTFGQNLGRSFKQQDVHLNLNLFLKGIEDALADKPSLLTPEEMSEILMNFQKERFAKQMAKQKELAEHNLAKGKEFLEANQKKEGVVTLPSGLQYKVVTEGTGKTPTAKDKVTTHYRGTLIDGTEFDSSYSRGQPATFGVDAVIKGWTEALQLMKEGAKWQLFIPSDLAYGDKGAPGGKIEPNSTLIFDIELISVEQEGTKEEAKAGDSQATEKAGEAKTEAEKAGEEKTEVKPTEAPVDAKADEQKESDPASESSKKEE